METRIEYQDASPMLADVAALRRRLDEDGYAFFRDLIPKEPVLELRRLILQAFENRGWIRPGTDLTDGIADPSINEVEAYAAMGVDQAMYQTLYRMLEFHRLAHHPAIVRLFERLLGEAVFVHPRNIARLMTPHKDTVPTPAHQDFIYVQGAKATYTCWFPIGDCPMELGGLSVMRGSHKLDVLPVRSAEGAGGRTVILDDIDQVWAQGGFEVGDALVFQSLTVHRSLPNTTEGRIRMSCDFRYQALSDPIEERSLLPHVDLMTWEEAYAGWDSQELKYYWRGLDLDIVDSDESLKEIRDG